MYHLTMMWLSLVAAAIAAGYWRGRIDGRRRANVDATCKLARFETLAFKLENQPKDWPPIPRAELAVVIRERLRGGS